MSTVTAALLALALVEVVELLALGVLVFAMVEQRRRHDRLVLRVGALAKGVSQVNRMRTKTTGEMPRTPRTPAPPFPVPPPRTNPITTSVPSSTGRHSAIGPS
jgi:hypothetical protein